MLKIDENLKIVPEFESGVPEFPPTAWLGLGWRGRKMGKSEGMKKKERKRQEMGSSVAASLSSRLREKGVVKKKPKCSSDRDLDDFLVGKKATYHLGGCIPSLEEVAVPVPPACQIGLWRFSHRLIMATSKGGVLVNTF